MDSRDSPRPEGEITQLLELVRAGDAPAREDLFRRVIDELRSLARMKLQQLPASASLEPTALVSEVYIRLFAGDPPSWENRRHFFFAAGRAMRDIIIEHARRERTRKRGDGYRRVPFHSNLLEHRDRVEDIIILAEQLDRLEEVHPRAASVINLRYFAELSIREIADALDISPITVRRDCEFARAWLRGRLDPHR